MYQYSFANVDLNIDCDFKGRPDANPASFKIQGFATGENLIFQQQADSDGQLITPIQAKITDNMGKDTVSMENGVILAMPALARGQTMNTVTWVITFETMIFNREIGGDVASL